MWEPASFIIGREYCEPDDLCVALGEWRHSNGHAAALLIPFSTEHAGPDRSYNLAYGSLMVASTEDDDIGDATLPRKSHARDMRTLGALLARAAQAMRSDEAVDDILAEAATNPVLAPFARGGAIALHVPRVRWTTSVVSIAVATRADAPALLAADSLDDLVVMTNATYPVEARRRDTVFAQRPDAPTALGATRAGDPHTAFELRTRGRRGAGRSPYAPPEPFTDLLREFTADSLSLYFCSADGDSLVLGAEADAPRAPTSVLRTDPMSPIAFTANRRRVRLRNDTRSPADLPMRYSWFGELPEPDVFSEISLPVLRGDSRDSASLIGVLCVQRSTHPRIFTSDDVTVLHQLCLRIALQKADLLFRATTEAFADLTEQNMVLGRRDTPPGTHWQQVPRDYVRASHAVTEAVELTHAYSASMQSVLYLLSYDQSRLIPVVACSRIEPQLPWPREIWAGQSDRSKPGLVSGVLLSGRPTTGQRSPNSGRPPLVETCDGWEPALVRRVRSWTIYPVAIGDRVIGVLALVGFLPSAFVGLEAFISAAATQIGLAVLFSQRAVELRAFAVVASSSVHAHDILNAVDELKQLPGAEEISARIRRSVDLIRQRNLGPDHTVMSEDLYSLIDDVLAQLKLSPDKVAWEGDRPPLPPMPSLVSLAVSVSMREIIKNALRYYDGRNIRLRMSITHRGGIPKACLEIRSAVRSNPLSAIEPMLFRVPLDDVGVAGGRRHFGAYVAGYWMRAVGGDVYLTENRSHFFAVRMDIPVSALMPRQKGT